MDKARFNFFVSFTSHKRKGNYRRDFRYLKLLLHQKILWTTPFSQCFQVIIQCYVHLQSFSFLKTFKQLYEYFTTTTTTKLSSLTQNYILQGFTEGIVGISFMVWFTSYFIPKNIEKMGLLTVFSDLWSDNLRYLKSLL